MALLLISAKYGEKSDTVKLIEAARARGIQTETLLNNYEKHLETNKRTLVAPYGEPEFCEFLAQEMGWNLYSNTVDWITRLDIAYVRRSVTCLTLAKAKELQATNQSILGHKVLEAADSLSFHTGIYTEKFPEVPDSTQIYVHQNVDWQVKYRLLVIEGAIATSCCYRMGNQTDNPKIYSTDYYGNSINAKMFVTNLLKSNKTAPACVIDVGFADEIGWAVCGSYPVWSSAVYGCDPDKFLRAIFMCCEPIN